MITPRRLIVITVIFTIFWAVIPVSANNPLDARPKPASAPNSLGSSAPGYCSSSGGSTLYESISSVTLTPNPSGTYKLVVSIFIANPTGCTSGQPCPEYDNSPEYVNVWIDWNGDKVWDNSEKVMDQALTGYLNINYSGTMTAVAQFSPPSSVTVTNDPTWMRTNLGWGHDPNDPCEQTWVWGDVVDKQVEFEIPEIKEITAIGVGTEGDNPQTGEKVRLEADLEVPTDYEITKCSWTGDLTSGNGDTANKCRYEYTPATGHGPAIATYGEKKVKLTVAYKHTAGGTTGQVDKEHTYKVFFGKGSPGAWIDDDPTNPEPNWFVYWKDDGAVPGLNAADVVYDPTKGAGSYGGWNPNSGDIELGGAAAQIHYPTSISVTAGANCPGGTFGGAKGIDCATEVIAHERYHETIQGNWQNGTWTIGTTADTDDPSPNDKIAPHGDHLPDNYENNTSHTDPNNLDSCDLEHVKGSFYRWIGDQEFMAMATSDGQTGAASNDWANLGKQTTPVYASLVKLQGSESSRRSGVAGSHDFYSNFGPLTGNGIGQLTGNYADEGIDTDGDGLYNTLKLSVEVEIEMQGLYNVVAWLGDGSGTNIVWAATQQSLNVGIHTVDLLFDGVIIRESGINGPYNVLRIELRVTDEEFLVDAVDNAYTTALYSYTDFDSALVTFTGIFSDAGVDTDGDSLYNLLRIHVEMNVQEAGTYRIIGELEGSEPIVVDSKTVSLSPGSQSVDLDFDGRIIFQSRQDGPYHLRRLRVQDASGNKIDFMSDAYLTASYTYDQFQHENVSIIANSYSDQGIDLNGDGDFDYLQVTFQLNAGQNGNYRVLADLVDNQGEEISSTEISFDLIMGSPFPVTLDFPGSDIFQHGVDGPYQVSRLTLLDAAGNLVDYQQQAHITQAYAYTDFGQPLVLLTDNYLDYGQDTDGDGFYDNLVIEIGVLPGNNGVIFANGRLVDSTGHEIEWVMNNTEMVGGTEQTIALSFNGELIGANGVDGPYELRDLYVYHSGDPAQGVSVELAHTTNAYCYAAFEGSKKINVKQGMTDIPSSTGSYDFGVVPLGSNSSETFTIGNLGAAEFMLTGSPIIQISGTHAGDFEVSQQPSSSTIVPGGSVTFEVTFTPSTTGMRTAQVSIPNDTPATPLYTFTITGGEVSGGGTFLYDEWHDAEKSPTNPDDDWMCWAAAAANILDWAAWDTPLFDSEQDIFYAFQDYWTNEGSLMSYGWHWWFDETEPPFEEGWAQVDVSGGGGYWSDFNFFDYFYEDWAIKDSDSGIWSEGSGLMATIDEYLHNNYGVTLAVYSEGGASHALSLWGYEYDEFGNYTGLYVTDSDDYITELQLLSVSLVDDLWYLGDDYSDWFIGGVQALDKNPIPEPAILLLFGTGLIGILALARRKLKKRK